MNAMHERSCLILELNPIVTGITHLPQQVLCTCVTQGLGSDLFLTQENPVTSKQ